MSGRSGVGNAGAKNIVRQLFVNLNQTLFL
jgi:hypothetical protein